MLEISSTHTKRRLQNCKKVRKWWLKNLQLWRNKKSELKRWLWPLTEKVDWFVYRRKWGKFFLSFYRASINLDDMDSRSFFPLFKGSISQEDTSRKFISAAFIGCSTSNNMLSNFRYIFQFLIFLDFQYVF